MRSTVRAAANDAAGGDPEAPWAVALCWGAGNNCEAVSARGHTAALEAEVAKLRRERDALRLACQMLITDGADLARLVDRARATLGADVDPALLAWARCVVAARGTIDGAER